MDKYIPVVVIKELDEVDKILPALKASGINCAEITFRTDCAAEAIKTACQKYPDMNIGAGRIVWQSLSRINNCSCDTLSE